MKANKEFLPFVLLLSVLISTASVRAQSVAFQVGKKRLIIPEFKADKVADYHNAFVNAGAIPSIKVSRADIEIRVYSPASGRAENTMFGNVYVVAYDSGRLTFKQYVISRDGGQALAKRINFYHPSIAADSFFHAAIDDKLFSLSDETSVIDSLKSGLLKANKADTPITVITCRDCLPQDSLLLEMKIHGRIRHFSMKASAFGEQGLSAPSLDDYATLRQFIYIEIYPETLQKTFF